MTQITINEAGQRLDRYLRKRYSGQPLGQIYSLIRLGKVRINGKKSKENYRLKEGDVITLPDIQEKRKEAFVNIEADFKVIFEDENILVVDKPAGLLVHPDSSEMKKTLINQVLAYLYRKNEYDPRSGSTFTPALCHRLDRNTSGLIAVAKTYPTLQTLTGLIRQKQLKRFYLCLVEGKITAPGAIELQLKKDDGKNQVRVSKSGLDAITNYRPIKTVGDYTLLEVEIITGRTHQIRVHFSEIGHPLIGDLKYGKKSQNELFRREYSLKRQFLHASKLVLASEKTFLDYLDGQQFKSDIPDDLKISLMLLEK